MKRSPEWWFLMAVATVVFGLLGWVLLKDLLDEHFWLFLFFYAVVVFLGDGMTALAAEKFAPSHIHVGPGERTNRHDTTRETAVAASDFDSSGRGRVIVRSEVWRARLAEDAADARVSKKDVLRIVGRDGLTLVVARGDS